MKHVDRLATFNPVHAFSGRLLVMTNTQRFQTEIDWRASDSKGALKLTHASSGKIVELMWQRKEMRWRDSSRTSLWQPVQKEKLEEMGILLAPWQLHRVFTGKLPATMETHDMRNWKGNWDGEKISVQWASAQQKVEISDFSRGSRIVVMFNE